MLLNYRFIFNYNDFFSYFILTRTKKNKVRPVASNAFLVWHRMHQQHGRVRIAMLELQLNYCFNKC